MRMTTARLILFRLLTQSFGRLPYGARLLRQILLMVLKKEGRMTYVAHAGFYDPRQTLGEGVPVEPLTPNLLERHGG